MTMSRPHHTTGATYGDSPSSNPELSETSSTASHDQPDELVLSVEAPADYVAPVEIYMAPTTQRVVQTLQLIQEQQMQLEDLDKERTKLLARLEKLEQEKVQVSQTIARHRSSISRFHSIPHDVLAIIFEFSENVSPWVWMRVNRMSRAVAMQTHSLWSKLLIKNDPSPAYLTPLLRWNSGRERCNTVPRLQRALARSTKGKVDVRIDINGDLLYPDDRTHVNELITTLQTAQSRIRSLDLSGNQHSTIESLPFNKFSFPNLETVILATQMVSVLKRIQDTATTLQSLQLRIPAGDELDWKLSPNNRIKSLDLRAWRGTGAWSGDIGPGITKFISSTRNLTHLTIHDAELSETAPKATHVLPFLEHLVLVGCHLHIKLDLPRLEILELDRIRFTLDGMDLVLPSLNSLKVRFASSDCFEVIRASKLESLDMETDTGAFLQLVETLIKKGYMSPKVLKLEVYDSRVNEDDLITALDSIQSLQDLSLRGTALSRKFFNGFAGANIASKTPTPRKTPICTSLRRFQLDLGNVGNGKTGRAMAKWLQQAVTVRQMSKHRLDQVLYKGYQRYEWESLS